MVEPRALRVPFVRRTARALNAQLRRRGFEVRRFDDTPPPPDPAQEFREAAWAIHRRQAEQTLADVEALNRKYADPVIGEVRVWDLIELQAQCIDPSDPWLYLASQEVHVLQMLDGMESDGVTDPEFVLAALIHDLGKVLLLTGEDPANVACGNAPIGTYDDGCGLDQCTLQWNHDEFGYLRFKDHVPDHIVWYVRYHSISPAKWLGLMDDRDRRYCEQYLTVLKRYDQDTKSPYALPTRRIDDYRDIIEDTFPKPIPF